MLFLHCFLSFFVDFSLQAVRPSADSVAHLLLPFCRSASESGTHGEDGGGWPGDGGGGGGDGGGGEGECGGGDGGGGDGGVGLGGGGARAILAHMN